MIEDYSAVTSGLDAQVVKLEELLRMRKFDKARELAARIQGQLNHVIISAHELEETERRMSAIRVQRMKQPKS
jgi:hypothetical protein